MTLQPGSEAITIHILANISQSKGKQDNETWSGIIMKQKQFFFSKIMQKISQGHYFQNSFGFLKKVYMR